MSIESIKPYWYDKDYKAPLYPKKKKDKGQKQKPLTKEQKEQLKGKGSMPWEL